ncbi:MAG: UDP-N-acetylmuramoyl-L-alanyl-D-glutamate--2,6-diaminopimelate ligase [Gammaproteobacteria bacterium]|nr:UDP-N-acetylmuramoyl-L-alanyl-D-glutamate--2,6-diaminopimelate ligase [Gammaproteobacteria bacterium]
MTERALSLRALLAGLTDPTFADVSVTGVRLDSREVRPGDLFCAYPGTLSDGRDYIGDALAKGAAAVVYEPAGCRPLPDADAAVVPVAGLRYGLGGIAARFFEHPSRTLRVIGVTGTNGKTTCTHLLTQALETLGAKCGLVGTLGVGFLDALRPLPTTTPDPVTLQAELRRMADAGATHACMEVSSHALDQGRVAGVDFDAAVFTNLTHEHLDYHQDMERYGNAKADLFTFENLTFAILNQDDPFSARIEARTNARVWKYGLEAGDICARSVDLEDSGIIAVLKTPLGLLTVHSALIGRINVLNLAAVATVLLAFGREHTLVGPALERLRPVPGRMELFRSRRDLPCVVVDYAHTPDALQHALSSIREHSRGRLWCVFGCGGDRDRGKRPMMGRVAESLADRVVLTDDNPRNESPAVIVDAIVGGMRRRPTVIHDRKHAIQWAIGNAAANDWVLVAGKGHETEQIRKSGRVPFNDRTVVHESLGVAA